jgi:hypothetical protein
MVDGTVAVLGSCHLESQVTHADQQPRHHPPPAKGRLVAGAHHGLAPRLQKPVSGETMVVPHPKKDLGKGLIHAIYKGAGWKPD